MSLWIGSSRSPYILCILYYSQLLPIHMGTQGSHTKTRALTYKGCGGQKISTLNERKCWEKDYRAHVFTRGPVCYWITLALIQCCCKDNVAMDEWADNTIEEKQYVDKSKAMKCVWESNTIQHTDKITYSLHTFMMQVETVRRLPAAPTNQYFWVLSWIPRDTCYYKVQIQNACILYLT